jgi:glycine/D-amino acid oxidase-like deaminating enzyme
VKHDALPIDFDAADGALPLRTSVVIIGGGIVGASAALCLAEDGIPTVLCEKSRIAGEQSGRNWGWCRKTDRDPRELPLIIESLRLWQGLNERVEMETGFRQTGILYLCHDEKELARLEAWLKHAKAFGLDSRILGGAEVSNVVPGSSRKWMGALHTPSDGVAEPQKAAPAIALAARRKGASVLTGCAVRGIETRGGRVAAAITEKGRIACDNVLLAGGAWSGMFCRSLGLRLPQLKLRASVMRTAPLSGAPSTAVWGPGFGFRKRLDGGYTIGYGANRHEIVPDSFRFLPDFLPVLSTGWRDLRFALGGRFFHEWWLPKRWPLDGMTPFERERELDPAPIDAYLESAGRSLIRAWPAFMEMKVTGRWAGFIDAMPDVLPVISPVDSLAGLYLATGFSGHGFGIGPAAGRLAADLITGRTPIVDPSPFRYSRFIDGSRPRPLTAV